MLLLLHERRGRGTAADAAEGTRAEAYLSAAATSGERAGAANLSASVAVTAAAAQPAAETAR